MWYTPANAALAIASGLFLYATRQRIELAEPGIPREKPPFIYILQRKTGGDGVPGEGRGGEVRGGPAARTQQNTGGVGFLVATATSPSHLPHERKYHATY